MPPCYKVVALLSIMLYFIHSDILYETYMYLQILKNQKSGNLNWGATGEYRFKIGDFDLTGGSWPKISGSMGRPHQFFLSENEAKWSFIWYNKKLIRRMR